MGISESEFLRLMKLSVDRAVDAVFWLARTGRLVYVNDAACRVLSYAPEELLELHVWDIDVDYPEARWEREWPRIRQMQQHTFGSHHRTREGHIFPVEITATYVTLDGAEYVCGFARDVTARERAVEELRRKEERLALALEVSQMGTWEWDLPGVHGTWNERHHEIFGLPPGSFDGSYPSFLGYVHPDDRERVDTHIREAIADRHEIDIEFRVICPTGEVRRVTTLGIVLRDAQGESVRTTGVVMDLTGRWRAEQAVREGEARLLRLMEDASDLISELDMEGRFVYASPNVQGAVGFTPEQLVGHHPFEMMHPEDRDMARRTFRDAVRLRQRVRATYRLRRLRGEWFWVESVVSPLQLASGETHVVVVTRDISERLEEEERKRDLEQRLQQAQKLESLGLLAGGIAHDFNNLLAPILGNASLALGEIAPESSTRGTLNDIIVAAQRASELTDQLLAYAGRPRIASRSVDLNQIVREMTHLITTGARGRAKVVYELSRSPVPMEADPSQLRQIVMNLVTNAAEAIDGTAGTITIRTGRSERAATMEVWDAEGEAWIPGRFVFLEIRDDGTGMDEATRARMFDPFFTTKFTGRGLGLAAVRGIVRAHEGSVRVHSLPGTGTTVQVYFPVSHRPISEEEPRLDWRELRGQGTILVIDDERSVLGVTSKILERAGFCVLTAPGGAEGVELFRRQGGEIDAVLVDLTMPGVPGEAVLEAVKEVRPGVPVLLMSGYTREAAGAALSGAKPAGFIHKPFTAHTLIEAMNRVLQEERQP